MFLLIYFLLFTFTSTQKCSRNNPLTYEQIYLCREELNSSSIRIWLYYKFNSTEEQQVFSYYLFTLRTLTLIDEHELHLRDRFEKQIGDYMKIDAKKKENHTIYIHHLSPGRYEICVNFLENKLQKSYHRSSNSCLYVPWNVPESEQEKPNLLIRVLLLISIIILLAAIAFFIYALREYFNIPRKPSVVIPHVKEDIDESERAKLLVRQHFGEDVKPLESLIRKRLHQRYAHRSPDLNDM